MLLLNSLRLLLLLKLPVWAGWPWHQPGWVCEINRGAVACGRQMSGGYTGQLHGLHATQGATATTCSHHEVRSRLGQHWRQLRHCWSSGTDQGLLSCLCLLLPVRMLLHLACTQLPMLS
ncbi:hypothetical protein V8C86DRAFT_2615040 [Haematococcus lacustris]